MLWQRKRRKVRKKPSAKYLEDKERARAFIHERLEYWNEWYNFEYKKVFIKNTSSRWGSCSKHKNLNFNYKLLYLPQELADYVVVHELCHLKEFNHGERFWKLVAQLVPDYRERRLKLKSIRL